MIGTSHPGIPYVLLGRANQIAWAITAALSDLSDLYREKVSEDFRQYQLDGEWKDFRIRREVIKVKGRDEPIIHEVRHTHRGPVVTSDVLSGAQVLFSEFTPNVEEGTYFSLAWTGHIEEDNTIQLMRNLMKTKSAKELFDTIDKYEYKSVPQNLIMAHDNGDISYLMGAMMPLRNNIRPYIGNRIQDGTTSHYDWIGHVKTSDLPRVINPKKGFIVTANNRQVPEHSKFDTGATITSTIRA
jgi:penicillin G amidase